MDLTDFIYRLEQMGIAEVLLPFILVFTLIYAILQTTKVLSEKKAINIVVGIAMGAGVVFPHVMGYYPIGNDPVIFINTFLPYVSIVVVAVITFLLLIGAFGLDIKDMSNKTYPFVILFALIFNFFTKEFFSHFVTNNIDIDYTDRYLCAHDIKGSRHKRSCPRLDIACIFAFDFREYSIIQKHGIMLRISWISCPHLNSKLG